MRDNLKKVFVLAVILIVSIVCLTGCSNEEAKEDAFSAIKERGYVVMGLDDAFAPMGFRDENNELAGFDVDLAKEVFSRIGLEVKLQPIDWTMKETELNSGNIDVIWNGYTITAERQEKVAFTKPYLENRQIIITLADSPINSKKDLEGKKVALQSESSAVDAIYTEPELVESFDGGEPIQFATNNEVFMDLEAKRVDAVVADEVFAMYYIKIKGPEKYKVLEEDFGDEQYGIGVRKSDKQLLEAIDTTLDEMREDGSYKEIYDKWFAD
ncbi:MAG TPA: amino acid ABC transporter substrate-binding protein [Thermoanaerobacterales bacterium]|nr:amino acid ABC transporter substrate-binding protein [Thermoanaerobacterales bacterium]